MKVTEVLSLIFLLFSLLYSNGRVDEINKANHYLHTHGEVYISFTLKRENIIGEKIASTLFVDKIKDEKVWAYGNSENFQTFLALNYPFSVETPPSMLGDEALMSDYSDRSEMLKIDRYPTYEGYLTLLEKFQTDYPEICTVMEIGKTVMGRKLMVLRIDDKLNDLEAEPKFFHSSTIHGDETAGYMLSLRMIDYLLSNYHNNPRVKKLIDSVDLYFCPLMNPDGTYNGGNHTVSRAKRTNANGKDLNRNYPQPQLSYAPFEQQRKAEIETEALMAFEKKHNFVLSIDNHGGIEAAYYPWSISRRETPDVEWFKAVARKYADEVHKTAPSTHFRDAQNGIGNWFVDMYLARGTRPDWQLFYRHCRELTIELSTRKVLSEAEFDNWWKYHKIPMLEFYEQVYYGIHGYVVDGETGEGITAKLFVEKHDRDSSHIYADVLGNYYRFITEGTYSLTFSHPGYKSKTIDNVNVKNGVATHLPIVRLWKIGTSVGKNSRLTGRHIDVYVKNKSLTITIPHNEVYSQMAIFNVKGQVLYQTNIGTMSKELQWSLHNLNQSGIGKGHYFIKISSPYKSITKTVILQ